MNRGQAIAQISLLATSWQEVSSSSRGRIAECQQIYTDRTHSQKSTLQLMSDFGFPHAMWEFVSVGKCCTKQVGTSGAEKKYWQLFRSIDSEVLAAHVGENNGRTKTMGTKLLLEPETRKFSGKPERAWRKLRQRQLFHNYLSLAPFWGPGQVRAWKNWSKFSLITATLQTCKKDGRVLKNKTKIVTTMVNAALAPSVKKSQISESSSVFQDFCVKNTVF